MSFASDIERRFADAVRSASGGVWQRGRLWQESKGLFLTIGSANPTSEAPESLVLEIRSARFGLRAYRVVDEWAFSYRSGGRGLPKEQLRLLDRVIALLGATLRDIGFNPCTDILQPRSELCVASFPTPYHRSYLESETPVEPASIEAFRRDGQVLVRRAMYRDVILAARPVLLSALKAAWPTDLPSMSERRDAYAQAFTQITDVGLVDATVRVFTHSRRIARMAADLMGVESVRLFCEDWLIKEPGAGITPWHQDEAVFPFDARETITCWIPLQNIGENDGLLRFAKGSHRVGLASIENINNTSEAEFARIIDEHGFIVEQLPPVLVGDVSFHHGRTIHGAFANISDEPRIVLALHFFAADARLKEPTTPTMARLFENAVPGCSVGDPAISPRWPLVYDIASSAVSMSRSKPESTRAFHVRVIRISDDAPIDLWIRDGRLYLHPIEGAEELATPGAFIMSGLVDSHSHISYPHERGAPVDSTAWMNARRDDYAATGVLLLRDMGAVDDAISALVDMPGLPRVHPAGNMILPFDEPPFTCTRPEELVRACMERVERGARWVKIFADWTSDYRDHIDPGFAGNDEVAYSATLLAEAVAAVHSCGARVAAHCFTRGGAEVAIAANVDSLEHGWGVDERLLSEMAQHGIAWVPLVGIASSLRDTARRDGQAARVQWVEHAMSELARLLPVAEALGVQIFAGTDRFPEVTVGDEIRQLYELGLSRSKALAAGAWAARKWLGEPGLEDGAPADFVLYRADPRADFSALFRPELILIGGKRIEPSFLHVRPQFRTWRERE